MQTDGQTEWAVTSRHNSRVVSLPNEMLRTQWVGLYTELLCTGCTQPLL